MDDETECPPEGGGECWGSAPPIFDLPPPPVPPWMDSSPCTETEQRPLVAASELTPTSDINGDNDDPTYHHSLYETCDSNPLVINSSVYNFEADGLFNVLV